MNIWKWVLIFAGSILLIGTVVIYNYRNEILINVLASKIAYLNKTHNLNITYKEVHFEGLTGVSLQGLSVQPKDRDTLLTIDKFLMVAKLAPLMLGTVKTEKLILQNGHLNLVNKDGKQNFDFLFDRKPEDSTSKKLEGDLSRLADKLFNEMLYKVPDKMEITNFGISVTDSIPRLNLVAQSIGIDNKNFQSTIALNKDEAIWHINGLIDPSRKKINLKFFAENEMMELPYLEQKTKLQLKFDTLQTTLHKVEYKARQLKMYTSWSVRNLYFKHPKINTEDIIVDEGSFDCNMFIGKNFISIDSSSTIRTKKIVLHPYFKYTPKPNKSYTLNVRSDKIPAQGFFSSFPKNLFSTLEGIQASGTLQYNLDFFLDSNNPDAVKFDSRLKAENFYITKFGNTNLQKINSTFVYTPYEKGKPMRSILVGPENPNYTSLEEIAPSLKYAVMTAEDGSFFRHRGFNEDAFKKSIALNYKSKKFKRGGSTISMQLVKNVFLNRQKTVARKLEEMLIVWLIENGRLVSKARMLEVYLNIIEWGPNVYGIGEAARFYFNKHPSQLNPGESIFLASIVPKPKMYKYSVTAYGTVRPYLRGYFRLVGGIMTRRGQLTGYDPGSLLDQVQLVGYSRRLVNPGDSIPPRNLSDDEEEEDQEIMLFEEGRAKTTLFPEPNFIKDWREKREARKKEREKKTTVQEKKVAEEPKKTSKAATVMKKEKAKSSIPKEQNLGIEEPKTEEPEVIEEPQEEKPQEEEKPASNDSSGEGKTSFFKRRSR